MNVLNHWRKLLLCCIKKTDWRCFWNQVGIVFEISKENSINDLTIYLVHFEVSKLNEQENNPILAAKREDYLSEALLK